MREKINKYKYYIFTFLLGLLFLTKAYADSGFDSSYDTDWGSSSDWGGTSDWSSNYDWNYNSSRTSGKSDPMLFVYLVGALSIYGILFLLFFKRLSDKKTLIISIIYALLTFFGVFFFFGIAHGIIISIFGGLILIYYIYSYFNKKNNQRKSFYVNASKFKDLNTKELQKELFDKFETIQNSWSKNDLEPVRSLLTDELFNTYQFQIDSMITTKQRNVVEDISFLEMEVIDHEIVDNTEVIKVLMEVNCTDYIIQTKNKKEEVIRGNKDDVNNYLYEMTFVRNIKNKLEYCTNCGHKLGKGMSEKCKYCGGVIIHQTDEYVLSKKQMLRQERR